jgi:hypothetical protein
MDDAVARSVLMLVGLKLLELEDAPLIRSERSSPSVGELSTWKMPVDSYFLVMKMHTRIAIPRMPPKVMRNTFRRRSMILSKSRNVGSLSGRLFIRVLLAGKGHFPNRDRSVPFHPVGSIAVASRSTRNLFLVSLKSAESASCAKEPTPV